MKIFPISDIHAEIWHPIQEYWAINFKFLKDIDVMVIAGDNGSCINNLSMMMQILMEFPNLHIVYVLGNHDYYGSYYRQAWEGMLWADYSIERLHVLTGYQYCSWEYNGVVFIGGTLWTDYNKDNENVKNIVQRTLNDYRAIIANNNNKFITPNFILNEHYTMRKYIFKNLEKSSGKKTIVVTHHKPYLSDIITDASVYGYEVDLTDDLNLCSALPEYWIYGHTHKSSWKTINYVNGSVTFVSNQFGYPSEDPSVTGFHKDCILEV